MRDETFSAVRDRQSRAKIDELCNLVYWDTFARLDGDEHIGGEEAGRAAKAAEDAVRAVLVEVLG